MKKLTTILEAELVEGKLVIKSEIYEGRKYFAGKDKEADLHHKQNVNFLESFINRAKQYWLLYN